MYRYSRTAEERFIEKVNKNAPNGCWEWTAKRYHNGYGMFTLFKKKVLAHRFAYETYVGPIPEGLWVLHTCDNPPCANPAHLWAGTPAQNMADTIAKGHRSGYQRPTINAKSTREPETPEQRFMKYVDKEGPTMPHMESRCWVWNGARRRKDVSYGVFTISGKNIGAHRFSYSMHHGELDPKKIICHHCDNPACVRPEHLFEGTYRDNEVDKIAKGRKPMGDNHWSRLNPEKIARGKSAGVHTHPESRPKGEQNGNAKLTDSLAREIYNRYKNGGVTQQQLANEHGVHRSVVGKITRKVSWVHATS